LTRDSTAQLYRQWAQVEAHGSSPTYERLALAVAGDEDMLKILDAVEPAKRQPNLLFGALRWHEAPVDDPDASVAWARTHAQDIVQVLRTRRTQTNEVARCATLLPALALLPQPLALIEVGASAGLCLLYEHWRYHYTGNGVDRLIGPATSPVTLCCNVEGDVPLPDSIPTIVWRAGLDLNPIDATDPDSRRWLQCLVWPEHHDRAANLAAALEVAADAAPNVIPGDLTAELPQLLEQVPSGASPVVVHSATLGYVDPEGRIAFQQLLRSRGVHRLGAEGPRVLPELARHIPGDVDFDGRFLASLDDRLLALAQPHGRSLRWL